MQTDIEEQTDNIQPPLQKAEDTSSILAEDNLVQ